jgi:hypothetical protein
MSKSTKILLSTALPLTGGQLSGIVRMQPAVPVSAVLQVFSSSLDEYCCNSELHREG